MAKSKDNNQKNSQGVQIKITHGRLHLELEPAIRVIGEFRDIDSVDVTMKIVKSKKNIDDALDTFLKTRKKIAEDLAEQDEDGRPQTKDVEFINPNTGLKEVKSVYLFKDKETEKSVNWKARELDEKEITVEIFPINYMSIKDCEHLTPNLIKASGEFIVL